MGLAQREDIFESPFAIAGHRFPSIAVAQDFRRIKENDPMRETTEEERGVDFTAALDEQAGHIFRAELF